MESQHNGGLLIENNYAFVNSQSEVPHRWERVSTPQEAFTLQDQPQGKEDHGQRGVNHAKKNFKTSVPSHDNVSCASQQYIPVLQWPYTTQSILHQSPIPFRPSLPIQQPQGSFSTQWKKSSFNSQQSPQEPQNKHPIYHPLSGSVSSESNHPIGSFWLPPGAANALPFTHIGTADATNRQTSTGAGGLTSSRNEHQIPSFCYQSGYPQPMGYPGTWNPSWWGQEQQPHPPCLFTYPGAYGYFPLPPPPVSNSSVAFGENHQRGFIRPQEKLSRKHQQMWEAQSLENIQLWAVNGQLRAELVVCGSRLMKLEAEVSSLKSTLELSTVASSGEAAAVAGSGSGVDLVGQTKKRGRPKKGDQASVLPSTDESQSQAFKRKFAPSKAPIVNDALIALKKSLDLEKKNTCPSEIGKSNFREQTGVKISSGLSNDGTVSALNSTNLKTPLELQAKSTLHSLIHQGMPRIQTNEFILNPSLEMQSKENNFNYQKMEHYKEVKVENTSASYNGAITNGSHGWQSKILSNDYERNFVDVGSQAFYNNVQVIRQGENFIPGWSFMNENITQPLEDVAVASDNDDSKEELEDASSGAGEMNQDKVVKCSYEVNPSGDTKSWLN